VRLTGESTPRSAAAAWAIIDLLPAHPIISAPVATAMTQRSKSRVYEAIEQLVSAGVPAPMSSGQHNRWWEPAGLLDLIGPLESGAYRRARLLTSRSNDVGLTNRLR